MVKCKKILSLLVVFIMCFALGLTVFADEGAPDGETPAEEIPTEETVLEPSVVYATQVQDRGWLEAVRDNEVSGTLDEARRMETLWARLENNTIEGGITYRSYIEGIGWSGWSENGVPTGSEGQQRAIRGLEIRLTGPMAEQYHVYYRVRMENFGWLDYAQDGHLAGTTELPVRLEAVQIILAKRGEAAPADAARPSRQLYEFFTDENGQRYLVAIDGVRPNGWFEWNGKRHYADNGYIKTGWHYIDGLKFYFDENYVLVQDVEAIIGKQDSYVIKVNKQANCVTIYAKDGNNGYIIPVKAMLCTTGDDTPIGTFKSPEKYRWRLMVNDTWSQYATRIIPGQGFLIHSVGFWEKNNHTLITDAYNYLGRSKSLGCVRLTTGHAKWVYDNCKIGTTIIIYNDPNPGPFNRPAVVPIPANQKWDPTDPGA